MLTSKRILIFNVNWLGDVLFSTPLIRNLRYHFAEAFLACAIPSRCYPILKGNPHLDEIIIYDEHDRHKGVLSKMKFVSDLKVKKFDTVFLLHRSLTRALIARLAGIPERIGYSTKKRGFLLTQRIIPPSANTLHRIDYYLNIIEKAGLKVEDRFTEFFFSEEDTAVSQKFLRQEGVEKQDFLVGINAGGNWGPKRWPKEYWARLADRLITEFKAKVIICGSQQDLKLADEICRQMQERMIVACGTLNLKQFGALSKRLDLFISADSGPLHIANAAGVKQLFAIFGPTSPAITGPVPLGNTIILQKDTGCKIPCYVVGCKDNRCMKVVTPEDVVEKVRLIKVNQG
jgi:lipopolysaccharide heptosyltransferase II